MSNFEDFHFDFDEDEPSQEGLDSPKPVPLVFNFGPANTDSVSIMVTAKSDTTNTEELVDRLRYIWLTSESARGQANTVGFEPVYQSKPYGPVHQTYKPLAQIKIEANPADRTKKLSQPSKDLNAFVNNACDKLTDQAIETYLSEINSVLDATLPSNNLFTLVMNSFERVYNEVAWQIRADDSLAQSLDEVFNGQLTFADSYMRLLFENHSVVPFLVLGLVKKMQETNNVTLDIAINQVLSIGEGRLNELVYGLRYGVNGALQGEVAPPPSDLFLIKTNEEGKIEVELDPVIEEAKSRAVINRNAGYRDLLSALEAFDSAAEKQGITLLFNPDKLGLLIGESGLCPVAHKDRSGGQIYLGQVQLIRRILAVFND